MDGTQVQRVIACVVRRDDRLLLCRRPVHKRHGGLWEFPGGKAASGESDEEAAARELREELDVRLVRAWPSVFEAADPGSSYVVAFVPVEIDGDPIAREHSSIVWRHPHVLAAMELAPSDRAFVEWLVANQSALSDA